VRQVQGAYGAQERSVHEVHEHLSTGATSQLSTVLGFGKKSTEVDVMISLLTRCEAAGEEKLIGGRVIRC
jgi:hypothetical protein